MIRLDSHPRHSFLATTLLAAGVAGSTMVAGPAAAAAAPSGDAQLLTKTASAIVAADPAVDPIVLPDGPNGTRSQKSLVIGLDGAMLDRIRDADTPNMDALMAAGTSALGYRYAPTSGAGLDRGASTSSGPGWASALTGVWPDKHGVYDNSFAGKRFEQYPDYLTRAEQVDPAISTFAIADWDPIADDVAGGAIISDAVDVRIGLRADSDQYGYAVDDARVADAASRYLAEQDPDLSFVYFGNTDIVGHGQGSASAEFLASLEADDARIGMLLNAIETRPSYAQEDWQIVVTNDHGHLPNGGHGGSSLEEREQFLIAAGGDVPAGPQRSDLNITDIAASVLDHVGIVSDPAWALDGMPFSDVEPDAFDSLRPALAPAVDETSVPSEVLGFTTTPPTGWTIDNSRMPTGGVTEWSGWSFTTNEFWSSADDRQGRENFTRGRNVIAVADSDEWDDAAHASGPFDSTLVSPAYDVTGSTTAALRFETHYQQEGAQTAEISVSFDGGAPVSAATYKENATGAQKVDIEVPAGAKSASVQFRYTGTNNWYWAIDAVTVTPGPTTPTPPTGTVAIAANAKSQCINGNATVAVYARNNGAVAADIRLSTAFGEQKYTKVAPGSAVYRIFDSGSASLMAATATVAGYTWVDGAGSYVRQAPAYAALSC